MGDTPPVLGIVQHVNITRTEGPQYSSSIEIGTPGKGGVVKAYVDLDDPIGSERRIREALRLRELMRSLSEGVPA